jgi:hypothetical protein
MPAETRGALATALTFAGPSEARGAAVMFLLDPDSAARRAVARALAQVAASSRRSRRGHPQGAGDRDRVCAMEGRQHRGNFRHRPRRCCNAKASCCPDHWLNMQKTNDVWRARQKIGNEVETIPTMSGPAGG